MADGPTLRKAPALRPPRSRSKPASAGTHERRLIVAINERVVAPVLPRLIFTKSLPSVVTAA